MMIELNNVKKTFPGVFAPVLNGIDLNLSAGEFCVLIGANGSGKSTLLKLINGENKPDCGSVKVDAQIAQVVQDVNVGTIPEMTLLENVALVSAKPKLAFYRRLRGDIANKIKDLNMGLEDYIDTPLKALSGGQKQAVAMFMAVNSGCKILLLDEHTSALDPKMQSLLMAYTQKQVTDLNLTTIMITHKMDDAVRYGDRLVMLHQGKIAEDIKGGDKKNLKPAELLALFHRYEDESLLANTKEGESA